MTAVNLNVKTLPVSVVARVHPGWTPTFDLTIRR
jgi:hypothetical protein